MPRIGLRTGVTRVLGGAVAAALALGLAACGSQLDPNDVAQATGGGAAAGSAGAAGISADQGGGAIAPGAGATGAAAGGAAAGSGAVASSSGGGAAAGGGVSAGGGAATSAAGAASGSGGGASSGGAAASPSTGAGGGHSGGGHGAAAPAGSKASCDGFKNGPGITDSTISIGNSSDISGPVPGLFESSQDAVKAYVAYFNATSDICGRKLSLVDYDSRTDAGADQQNYAKACDEVFAMVGSMSAFDSGGASTAQSCGLPDIRSASVTKERNACSTCFPAQSVNTGQWENAPGQFVLKNYPDDAAHAAILYINAGAAAENAPAEANAMTKQGLHFDVVQGIDVSEFNYAPYAQQLKDKGVKVVFWVGNYQYSVRLAQAFQQVGYKPDLYLRDPTDYNPDYVSSGGDAVDGTVVFMNFVPFEEASSNQEMQTYLSWLQQVSPGADPTFFGVFSWSAAELFVEKAQALGGQLSRSTLIDALSKTDNWTANGMTAPQHVGSKQTGDCWRFIQLNSGTWQPVDGTKYSCDGTTNG